MNKYQTPLFTPTRSIDTDELMDTIGRWIGYVLVAAITICVASQIWRPF